MAKHSLNQNRSWIHRSVKQTAYQQFGTQSITTLTNAQRRDVYQMVCYAIPTAVDAGDIVFRRNSGIGGRMPAPHTEQVGKAGRLLAKEVFDLSGGDKVTIIQHADGTLWVKRVKPGTAAATGAGGQTGAGQTPQNSGSEPAQGQGQGQEPAAGEPTGEPTSGIPALASEPNGEPENGEPNGEPTSGQPEPTQEPQSEPAQEPEAGEPAQSEPEPQPEPNSPQSEMAKFLAKLADCRAFLAERKEATGGNSMDNLDGFRPGNNGASMIAHGITADAAVDAMTAHWPEEVRSELGIVKTIPAEVIAAPKGTHPATGYVLALIQAEVPVMLYGPPGTGKTTLAIDVAKLLNLPFGMVSMAAGLSPTALTGASTLDGFVSRPCVDTFSEGGVFLFDEMDAADPNTLLITNSMLANGVFHNPSNGAKLTRHENWVPLSAVNTLTGASASHTGRSLLDGATMDRWRMGRVRIEFDANLANNAAWDVFTAKQKAVA